MAQSPRFKIHNPQGEYIASCKLPEDAAALIAGCYGDRAKIRDSVYGITVWIEGREDQPAGESFDFVATTVWARINAHADRLDAKRAAKA